MIQDRRTFIGATLGFIGITPFVGVEIKPRLCLSKLDRYKRLIRLHEQDDNTLEKCKLFAYAGGKKIGLSKVIKVKRKRDESLEFKCEQIAITSRFTIDAIGFIDDENYEIEITPLSHYCMVEPGDKFVPTYLVKMS